MKFRHLPSSAAAALSMTLAACAPPETGSAQPVALEQVLGRAWRLTPDPEATELNPDR